MEHENSRRAPQESGRMRRARKLRLLGWASFPFVVAAGVAYALLAPRLDSRGAGAGAGPVGQPPVAVVKTASPTPQVMNVSATLRGVVIPTPDLPVALTAPAWVRDVRVRPQRQVKAGDVLAVVEPVREGADADATAYGAALQNLRIAHAALAAARGNLAAAEADLTAREMGLEEAKTDLVSERDAEKQAAAGRESAFAALHDQTQTLQEMRVLLENGALPRMEVEAAQAEQDAAEASLDEAEEALDAARSRIQAAVKRVAAEQEAEKNAQQQVTAAQREVRAAAEAVIKQQKLTDQAESRLAAAQGRRAWLKVRAPADGVVSGLTAQAGMLTTPAMVIMRIKPTSIAVAAFELTAAETSKIKTGMQAVMRVPNKKSQFKARVGAVGPASEGRPEAYRALVAVRDPSRNLKPKTPVVAQVSLGKAEVIVVPRAAVVPGEEERARVWIAKAGKAHARRVKLGGYQGDLAAIIDGLKPGDAAIVSSSKPLKEGMRVRPVAGPIRDMPHDGTE